MENSSNTELKQNLNLFLGSYEGKVFCVEMDLREKNLNTFSFKASDNSIKAISTSENFIFVSGVDEIIHIYDYKKKKELGTVVSYSGTITNIRIFKSFMFACGDDPTVSIWRMSDFSRVHSLKGHKKAITHFIVHKSGRFAISASRDNSVIIWNLLTGRALVKYRTKEMTCNKILFIKGQKLLILVFDNELWVFDLFKDTKEYDQYVIKKVNVDNKIFDAFVVKSDVIVFHADGTARVYFNILDDDCTEKPFTLAKPIKDDSDDLDVRVKLIDIALGEKFSLLNVVYSNNEIFIYDLNKIVKRLSKTGEGGDAAAFRTVNLKTSERITNISSQII
jgi:WD40 repeat protein